MTVYLDNAATTRCRDEVAGLVEKLSTGTFGNPASLHHLGVEAEHASKEARSIIADSLKCRPENILFTSGGTESNNMALIGTARANRRQGMHLITSVTEHPSVLNTMAFLEEEGFLLTLLKPDATGQISAEQVLSALRPDTVLVSLMAVNNEIGTLNPVQEIGERLKKEAPQVLFHVDAVQAYGKYEFRPKRQGIDLMSASAHKIHGPKGVGFLYIGDGVKIRPLLFGGGQQKGLRSGTENVPGEAGFGLAAELAYRTLAEDHARMCARKAQLLTGIMEIPDVRINGRTDEESAPHILSASFSGVRSEVLLHALEDKGIYVSSGSACSAHKGTEVGTLSALGLSKEEQEGTIRFSLSRETTEEEIAYTVETLKEQLAFLRRFVRR